MGDESDADADTPAENTDIDVNATSKLVLRTHRFPTFQSAAEVESEYAHSPNLHKSPSN